MGNIWERAFANNMKVREKETGIIAEVVEAFGDGELYLDEGTTGISPVTEYNENDFEIAEE